MILLLENRNVVTDSSRNSLNVDLLSSRTLFICGEINLKLSEQIIRQLIILEKQNNKPITMYIDSPQGDFDYSFAIYDTIRFISSKVYIIAIGTLASASILVLLATPIEYRFSLENTSFNISFPRKKMDGKTSQIQAYANQVVSKTKIFLKMLFNETNLEQLEEEDLFKCDIWMDASKAVSCSFIHKILKNISELTFDKISEDKVESEFHIQVVESFDYKKLNGLEVIESDNYSIITNYKKYLKVYNDKLIYDNLKDIFIPLLGEIVNAINLFWYEKNKKYIDHDILQPLSSRINIVRKYTLLPFCVKVINKSNNSIVFLIDNSNKVVSKHYLIKNNLSCFKEINKLIRITLKIFKLAQKMLKEKEILLYESVYSFGKNGRDLFIISDYHNLTSCKMIDKKIVNYGNNKKNFLPILGYNVIHNLSPNDSNLLKQLTSQQRLDIMNEHILILKRIVNNDYKFTLDSPAELKKQVFDFMQ